MAESPEEVAQQQQQLEEEEEEKPSSETYKIPEKKSLDEIVNKDQDDESLRKYKEALLGQAKGTGQVVIDPSNPKNVIVDSMELISDDKVIQKLDLKGEKLNEKLSGTPIVMKEGANYQTRIKFYVQREIVSGLKYSQKLYRGPARVDSDEFMIGSYAPKQEMHEFTTKEDVLPSGMLARGTYKVKSLFTDDDKDEFLKWEWIMELKKDWKK